MDSDQTDESPPRTIDHAAIEAITWFLPMLEAPGFCAGEWRGGTDDGSGTIDWPWFDYAPEVRQFIEALYDHGWIVPFDWSSWQPEAERLVNSGEVDRTDAETLRRLLTLIARKERFCDGFLAVSLQEGLITRILRRLDSLAATSFS